MHTSGMKTNKIKEQRKPYKVNPPLYMFTDMQLSLIRSLKKKGELKRVRVNESTVCTIGDEVFDGRTVAGLLRRGYLEVKSGGESFREERVVLSKSGKTIAA